MEVWRINSATDAYRTPTTGGALTETRAFTTTPGAGAEFIVLQQPWILFAGEHGIEPQHCMLCRSEVIAEAQSAT